MAFKQNNVFLEKLFGGLILACLSVSMFADVSESEFQMFSTNLHNKVGSSNDASNPSDPLMSMMSSMMGGDVQGDTGFDIQALLAEMQKSFDERLKREFEENLKLLPDNLRKLFEEQEGNFERVNRSLQLENHVIDTLNKTYLSLKRVETTSVDSKTLNVSSEKIETFATKILEALEIVYFCIDKGYINTFIKNGFLKGVTNKVESISNFVTFDKAQFHAKASRGPVFPNSIVKTLKEYSKVLKQHANEISDTSELKLNLLHLVELLNVLSNQDFNAFLNLSLNSIQFEVDNVYKILNFARFDFENYLQNLKLENSVSSGEQKKAAKFIMKKLDFYKKSLDNFYSYKNSLNVQKNLGYQLFYKSCLYTYDFYGRAVKYLPRNSKFKSIFVNAPIRGLAAVAYFFDVYMLAKGVSILDVLKGNGDLKSAARSKMALQILALFKSFFIMFSSGTFSFDKVWMVGSIMQLTAAFTYYHFLNPNGGNEFWPGEDSNIKNAVGSILNSSKKSASRLVEHFVWSLNPSMVEKVEEKTFGVVSPDLVKLMFDLVTPSLVNNYFPQSVANFHEDDSNDFGNVAARVGAEKNFIEVRHPLKKDGLSLMGFTEEQIGALQDYGFKAAGQAGFVWKAKGWLNRDTPEWWKIWKKKADKDAVTYTIKGVEFSEVQKKLLDNYISRRKYTKAEFIEGKILGYIFSQFGNHFAKSLVMNNKSTVRAFAGKVVDKGTWFLNKIGIIDSPEEEIRMMREEFAQSMGMLKEILVNMIYSTKDSSIVGTFLYNAAGTKILTYGKAAMFFRRINNNMGNMNQLREDLDDVFDAIADKIYGNIAGWVGSKFMLMVGSYVMNQWGPFYPRFRGAS